MFCVVVAVLFDEILRMMLGHVTYICFSSKDSLWLQASLPVWCGGLGIRIAVQLAPLAFLSCVAGILPLLSIKFYLSMFALSLTLRLM